MSIEVKGLTHIYSEGLPDESLALEDISFRAEDGQLVGLIGHTGSGKSTLVQHLNGLLKPKKGHIIVGDVDITAENVVMRDIRRKIGLVFQYPEYQLFEETVAKDVAFGPSNLGLTAEEVDEEIQEEPLFSAGEEENNQDPEEYKIWFENLRDDEYSTYFFDNENGELRLNTENLDRKSVV